ncbi:MAG: phosphoglucomutase [Candidatus Anoxymicrobium japonicum]|uniref:Phosphoglucomutase n=1 Tax=Candidatus Anoxymicrobium japonicum TaxID=2013648 RepID=A0A2N3G889_9ACTN|nr:MAG: phosphoglucomutase [Candidatus Anoxymicrobium japonicum]
MTEITFGTDGWRSTVNTDFNRTNVEIVTQAICNYLYEKELAQKGCVVAYDTRAHSEGFADLVSNVLMKNGIAALRMETFCPTPQAAFAVKHIGAAGAIMLTASHNPPEYNGIKFIPHYGGPATPDITGDIEWEIGAILEEGHTDPPVDRTLAPIKKLDVSNEYIKQLLSLVERSMIERSHVKILFDPMYGSGQNVFMRALAHMDAHVTPLHCHLDSEFGGLLPEPIEPNLTECKKAVLVNKSDLGIALDGDADRFGVVDSKGVYLTPNKALTLMLWYLLTYKPTGGAVARSIATTHMLDTIAEHNGCRVLETPVGFKYIGELMRKKMIILGGEESGGVSVAGHIPEKDGLMAGLILIEIAARFKKPLSELLENIYNEFGPCFDERIDVKLPESRKETLMDSLSENPPRALGDEDVVKVNLSDGVKVITAADTWMLVRASGTEPMVRVYIEARGKEAFDRARKTALKIIKGHQGKG